MLTPRRIADAIAKAERMLDLAPLAGVDLREMNEVRVRLAQHEAMFATSVSSSERNELERLMSDDIAELCRAYKTMERAVERGGEA